MKTVENLMDLLHNRKSPAVRKPKLRLQQQRLASAQTSIRLLITVVAIALLLPFSAVDRFFDNNDFYARAHSVANMSLNPVVISASAKQTATVIFLHGLGDSGNGWAEAMTQIRQPYVKVICPSASPMPVSLNQGFRMPSWFDLFTLDESGPEDESGIKEAAKLVHSFIDREIETSKIPSSRIALGGFSQGGALALYSAFTYSKPLAGVMALSCWIPLHKSFPSAAIGNKEIPIIQCHGDCDPIVPLKWGQLTASILKSFAKNTEFKTYRGLMHSSSDTELIDLKKFLETVLPPV